MLIVAWDTRGVRHGPLFRTQAGGVILMSELDSLLHRYLVQVQSEHPESIPLDICVEEDFSLHRSLC